MAANAERVRALVSGRERGSLESDWVSWSALIRQFEVIGEAAGRVSEETRAALPTVPWRSIMGMRNRLIHGHDVIDPEAVWRAPVEDLPELLAQLRAAVRSQDPVGAPA